jgi:peptidoglycan/LPS O-acetylase OafA/YrhL
MKTVYYRPDIDGLRAISVVLVILFHFGITTIPGGFVGVDVFFVISGYLITNLLLENAPSGSRAIIWFYDRRVRRIMPAILVVIGVSLIAGQVILPPPDLAALRESAFYSITSLANFYFLSNTGYFDSAAERLPLLHIWSLAVEEQFYIVWPLLLFCLIKISSGRKSVILMIIGAGVLASFVVSIKVVASDSKSAFFLPHTRAWELGLGAMLSLIPAVSIRSAWVRETLPVLGLSLIFFSAMTLTASDPFPGLNALAPCLGAALVVLPVGNQTQIGSVLGYAPLQLLGKISYSLYLWHWPVLVFFRFRSGDDFPTMIEAVFLIVVSTALAWLTWKYVETPLRQWKPKLMLKSGIVATFAFVTATGTTVWAIDAIKTRNWTAEKLIVREQFNRARTVNSVDIAFFGDSSCLTGIHPPTLRAALGGKSVESFCMFGSVGAIADAKIIELLAQRGSLPRAAVVVVHPFQFRRLSILPEWASFIYATASAANSDWTPAIRVKGDFAPRYHRATDLVEEIRNSGSLVDPSHGPNTKTKVSYLVPQSFEGLMAPLTRAITLFEPRDVYLIFPPIPEGSGSGDSDEAAKRVAGILGIPEGNFLPTSKYMPVDRFATFTHLNEMGRSEFSQELAQIIQKRILVTRSEVFVPTFTTWASCTKSNCFAKRADVCASLKLTFQLDHSVVADQFRQSGCD